MAREILNDDPTDETTGIERLRAVSPADIQRVAQQSLRPNDTAILVSGPAPQLAAPLTEYGPVQMLSD